MEEIAFLDATAQAELVRRGDVSPVELVEVAIERIERINPAVNAVVTPKYDEALEAARVGTTGPFAGVPFLLKDLVAQWAGARQTEGSFFLRDFVANHDSELVSRVKRAGFLILAKTTTPEFGNLCSTESRLFGKTRNPWDLGRIAGGSSGGAGAAVAARLVPVAHGNDAGGSIRIPASCCGVFGFKPTRGRNPLGPDFGEVYCGLLAEHALTRSVRDSAALLDATSGPGVGDPYYAPVPPDAFVASLEVRPKRLRIAISTETPTGGQVDPECARAVEEAAELCAELGHFVEEGHPKFDGEYLRDRVAVLLSEGYAWLIDMWARRLGRSPEPEAFEPLTWALQDRGRGRSASEHLMGLQDLQRVARQIAEFFVEIDVWMTPTLSEPPVPLGTFDAPPDDPLRPARRDGQFSPFTLIANVTGQPAMSVPLRWTARGLPVGTHFVGRFGEDATLFSLAGQLEKARPWSGTHPAVALA